VTHRGLRVRTHGGSTTLDLTVRPLTEPDALRGLCMVVFDEVGSQPHSPAAADRAATSAAARQHAHVAEVERELKQAREQLQTTIEEMETSQEELKSSNEELQSTNEELQSTNEELTTSKEEMQSLNEELVTVNTELQVKVDELSLTSIDMKNLLNSTEIATVFLDNVLNIKRYTPQATRLINLIPGDVGRPLEHIVANLRYESLVANVREVLQTLVFKEVQIQTTDDRWHLMRIMPYRTLDNVIDGVVITFIDITAIKHLEVSLRQSDQRLHQLLEKMPVMLAAADEHQTILFWNRQCEQVTGWRASEVVGKPDGLRLRVPNEADRAKMLQQRKQTRHRRWEMQLTCKNGSVKTIAWSGISATAPIPGWAEWSVGWEIVRPAK